MLLADSYIHVEFSEAEQFNALARKLEKGVVSFAREIFVGDAKVQYLLEEGTLIERARIIKTLIYILGAIAGYHELRESIIDLYKDANLFSSVVIEQFHKATGTSSSDVIYKRTIPTDVRRLYRIVQNADRAQKEAISQPEWRLIRGNIISDIAGLHYSNPDDEGLQVLLNNLPKKKIPELPETVATVVQINQRRRETSQTEGLHAEAFGPPPRERRRRRRYLHTTMI